MNQNSIRPQIQRALAQRRLPLGGKTALVTGASSGIGLATAVKLALEGCNLHLVARRKDRLQELKQELLNLNPGISVKTMPMDLTSTDSIKELDANGATDVDILINNAGLASGFAKIIDSSPADWSKMLDTNVGAAFEISRRVAAQMIRKNSGDIVVLSSVAAHFSYENGAVYCATKHAVKAFHEALRLETLDHGIRVMMISPGMVETEFSVVRFAGDHERAQSVYRGLQPLDAGDVAESIVFALQQPKHINLDDIIIKPQQQGNPWKVFRRS
ncbi:MAG: SDR family NAD(P)-dependent oxidoreductase [Silvanigrellaceae bacterium]